MINRKSANGYEPVVDGVYRKTLVYGKNTLMTEFLLKKGKSLPLHKHPQEQTGYLVSGKLILFIGTEQYEFDSGDSWVIPGDLEHSAEIIEDSVAIEVFSPIREDYLPKFTGPEKVRWNFNDSKCDGPDFNAKGNEIAIDTLTLTCEYVERAKK